MNTAGQVVFIGIRGTVLALNRMTGTEIWRTPLSGNDFVNLVLDGGDLFATTRGQAYCLDPTTGGVRWNNGLRGFGYGLATLAVPGTAPSPAAMAEYIRQNDAAVAASTASTTVFPS